MKLTLVDEEIPLGMTHIPVKMLACDGYKYIGGIFETLGLPQEETCDFLVDEFVAIVNSYSVSFYDDNLGNQAINYLIGAAVANRLRRAK
jgi:hypothetical protein